jgi:hypothetical protein
MGLFLLWGVVKGKVELRRDLRNKKGLRRPGGVAEIAVRRGYYRESTMRGEEGQAMKLWRKGSIAKPVSRVVLVDEG